MKNSRPVTTIRKAHAAAEQEERAAWLIGLRLNPAAARPELFAITLQARNYGWPVMAAGRSLLFWDIALANEVLSMDDDELTHASVLPPLTLRDTYVYEVGRHIHSLRELDSDDTLVDFLNLLNDWSNALNLEPPAVYKLHLYELAEHLTFESEFATFLMKSKVSRTELLDCVHWYVGAILVRSDIVTHEIASVRRRAAGRA